MRNLKKFEISITTWFFSFDHVDLPNTIIGVFRAHFVSSWIKKYTYFNNTKSNTFLFTCLSQKNIYFTKGKKAEKPSNSKSFRFMVLQRIFFTILFVIPYALRCNGIFYFVSALRIRTTSNIKNNYVLSFKNEYTISWLSVSTYLHVSI